MFLTIPDLLRADELTTLQTMAERAAFDDGTTTTGGMPGGHKNNLQYVPQGPDLNSLSQIVRSALNRSDVVRDNVMIKNIMPPMISKYQDGMEYKSHLDAPFMHHKGPVRTDMSMTLFLSDPDSYDGGALVLETDFGDHEIKLPAGGAVVYSTRLYHRVTPVTGGARIAVVTWIQSHIADPAQRKVIGEIWHAYDDMVEAKGETSPEAKRLMFAVLELTRMWADG